MFAKENKRRGEKRGGRNQPQTRRLRTKITVHPRRLLSRFIGISSVISKFGLTAYACVIDSA